MRRFAPLGLLLFLTAIPVWAQSVPAQILVLEKTGDNTPFVTDEEFPGVSIEVVPLDDNGLPITDLVAENFRLQEDAQPVPAFNLVAAPNPAKSISLLVLLDLGQAMQPYSGAMKTAVTNLYTLLEQPDESGLLAFSRSTNGPLFSLDELDPTREMAFTNDEGALTNLVNSLAFAESAPLYDALVKGLRLTTADARHQPRALIIFTNGRDTASQETATTALREAENSHIPIFVIALGTQTDTLFLEQLAEASGGTLYQVTDTNQLNPILSDIVARLKHSYHLQYQSAIPPDEALHTLNITAVTPTGESDVTVEFQARYPLIPMLRGITAVLPPQTTPVDATTLTSVKGRIILQPDIVARNPIQSVNYFINDRRVAIHSSTAPPWSFEWDTTTLAPGLDHTLLIEIVDDHDPPHVGVAPISFFITTCNLLCQAEQTTGLHPLFFPLVLVALLVAFAIFIIQRRPQSEFPTPTPNPVLRPARRPLPPIKPEPSDPLELFGKPKEAPPAAKPGPPEKAKTELLHNPEHVAFLIDVAADQTYRLETKLSIGRESYNDVILDAPRVAPRHTQIIWTDGAYVARNLNTGHVTKVNGAAIGPHYRLKDGDHLEVGDHLFVFRHIM